jgi:replicative DNA helicase
VTKDVNDRLREGTLPDDPMAGSPISEDVARVHSERDLLMSVPTTVSRRVYGTTGSSKLDDATGGLRPEDVWMIGADTSWGKSSFAVRLYDENLKRGKKTLIVSAEDSKQTYGARLLRRRTRVPAKALRDRRLTTEQRDLIAAEQAKAIPNACFIDARGKTIEWLCGQVKQAVKAYGIDVVCFDYVGAFAAKLGQQDKRNMITYIARNMADVAKTSGVCGVIFSQVTPGKAERDGDKYALRDSNDLVHMAEVMLLGWIADKDHESGAYREGDRMLKITKCKEGDCTAKSVRLAWDPTVACFDTEHDEEQERIDALSDGFEDAGIDWDERYR